MDVLLMYVAVTFGLQGLASLTKRPTALNAATILAALLPALLLIASVKTLYFMPEPTGPPGPLAATLNYENYFFQLGFYGLIGVLLGFAFWSAGRRLVMRAKWRMRLWRAQQM